ncbi:Clp protease N-terminal domain-containing protein [Actinomycetospora sp. CA-101289]|uniref:Clp protease N-terminal domain-containing protein n=1 Tax=Actinomycetospora sp. CA-101289 TaxID=3239893 RepID=UPI003D959A75
MGTTTPIHDALAEALRELQQDLDLAREVPVARAVDDPVVDDEQADDDPAADTPLAPTVAPDAEQVVALAWREADERDHARFGTGHLLLGLVRAEGPEAGLLAAVGVTARTAGAAMTLIASSSISEPVEPCGDHDPVADTSVAEVLEAAADSGHVTGGGLLTTLLARPWGQAAEMLAALGVEPGQLATAATEIAVRPVVAPRPMPRDPSGLLSAAWRRPATAETMETADA